MDTLLGSLYSFWLLSSDSAGQVVISIVNIEDIWSALLYAYDLFVVEEAPSSLGNLTTFVFDIWDSRL